MRSFVTIAILAFCSLLPARAKDLKIYFIDVEGGQATLIVSPSGQSMLVDAGWPGNNGRDADRIVATARKAGVKQIDYLLVTHYHLDHVGGVEALAAKFPIKNFVDHGENTETGRQATELSASYEKARAKGKRIIVKPGDRIPLKGVEIEVVAARGEHIAKPLTGAGQPVAGCADVQKKDADPSENGKSVGFILRYGEFRFADLADLTWNNELALVCPNNLIGNADLFLISHHGMNISNSPVLVKALAPRVAVLGNGIRKGASADALMWIQKTPGVEDIWQLHYTPTATDANAGEAFIANLGETCLVGEGIEVSAEESGHFEVMNTRTRFSKKYKK
jgi:beta-lactamase superfamily II metal-dependent hydrolase